MTPEYQHDLLQLIMFLTSLLGNVWLAIGWSKSRDRAESLDRSLMSTVQENHRLVYDNDELRERVGCRNNR